MIDFGKFNAEYSPDPNELIGDGFFSLIETNDCCDMVDFTIDFGVQQKVYSVFIMNLVSFPLVH